MSFEDAAELGRMITQGRAVRLAEATEEELQAELELRRKSRVSKAHEAFKLLTPEEKHDFLSKYASDFGWTLSRPR